MRVQVCDVLERIAQADNHGCGEDLKIQIWSQVSTGITVLGTPLVDLAFVESQLDVNIAQQRTLLKRIFVVRDLQSAWLLLLHCASAWANYLLRVVEPQAVRQVPRRRHLAVFVRRSCTSVGTCLLIPGVQRI